MASEPPCAPQPKPRGAFPGCDNQRFLDAHHIVHWAEGGETSEENLVLLCSGHHRAVHEHGFKMRKTASGELTVTAPDGRLLMANKATDRRWLRGTAMAAETHQTRVAHKPSGAPAPSNTSATRLRWARADLVSGARPPSPQNRQPRKGGATPELDRCVETLLRCE